MKYGIPVQNCHVADVIPLCLVSTECLFILPDKVVYRKIMNTRPTLSVAHKDKLRAVYYDASTLNLTLEMGHLFQGSFTCASDYYFTRYPVGTCKNVSDMHDS
jgi:hypothetical protein